MKKKTAFRTFINALKKKTNAVIVKKNEKNLFQKKIRFQKIV